MGIRFIAAEDVKDIEQARKSIMQSETNLSQANHTIRYLESEIARLVQELTLSKLNNMRTEPETVSATLKIASQQKLESERPFEGRPQTFSDLKALEKIEELKLANEKLKAELSERDVQIKNQNTKIISLECAVSSLKSETVKLKKER